MHFWVCITLLISFICIRNKRRRNISLVARYSLKFTRCSLLLVKTFVTCCKIRLLLVAEVARCKKSLVTRFQNLLVTRCRSCSFQKVTRYSLQKLLVAKKSFVTRCKIRSILVAEIHSLLITEVAHCKKLLVTRYKIRSLLIALSY